MSTTPDTTPGATIEPVDREAYERERARGELTTFGYNPNSRGFIFLQICSGLLFVIAWLVYLSTSFAQAHWALLGGALTLTGVGLIGLVVYWSWFARTAEIAFDDRYLYVTRWGRTSRLPWTHLDAEAAGFADDRADGDHGSLEMTLGGQQVSVTLFNAFLVVDDFPTFLVELLTQIKRNAPDPDDDDDHVIDVDAEEGTPHVAALSGDDPAARAGVDPGA